jgi:hypothetical protein
VSDIVLDNLRNKLLATDRAGARYNSLSYSTEFLLPCCDHSQDQLTIRYDVPKSFKSQHATDGTSHEETVLTKRKFDQRRRKDIKQCDLNGIAEFPLQKYAGALHEL